VGLHADARLSILAGLTRAILLSVVLCISALPAFAATCAEQATEKKLAGTAKNSFIGKCEKDAKAACESTAVEKKLNGAAKTSFITKCVGDAAATRQQ